MYSKYVPHTSLRYTVNTLDPSMMQEHWVGIRTLPIKTDCVVSSATHTVRDTVSVGDARHACVPKIVQGLRHHNGELSPLLSAKCEGGSPVLPGWRSTCSAGPAYSLLGCLPCLVEWPPWLGTPHRGRHRSAAILHPTCDLGLWGCLQAWESKCDPPQSMQWWPSDHYNTGYTT